MRIKYCQKEYKNEFVQQEKFINDIYIIHNSLIQLGQHLKKFNESIKTLFISQYQVPICNQLQASLLIFYLTYYHTYSLNNNQKKCARIQTMVLPSMQLQQIIAYFSFQVI
ncbi:hypothetical protein FGO68_gene17363 [Halteria grandinella]|uniref:Uncharacterized protein n=1 Tax=Halteria grandinella TaxID=5974 RepID=A0A8J8NES9_HALGN|nr:hypothetical protein FGO68_gene17363 [Halteria grandinella]